MVREPEPFVFLVFSGECAIYVFDEEDGAFGNGGDGLFEEGIIDAGKIGEYMPSEGSDIVLQVSSEGDRVNLHS